MASIGPVSLAISPLGTSGNALIEVSYEVTHTLDDIAAGRHYREVVQLFAEGRRIGEPGIEHPVPNGTIWDGTVVFTDDAVSFVRGPEATLPLAALLQTGSPLQPNPIVARVTLTPLPPMASTRESSPVDIDQPPTKTT